MAIYFKKEPTENITSYLKQEDVPAHEKIGAIYAKALSRIKINETDSKEFSTLMQNLGVHPQDETAEKEMIDLLKTLGHESSKIVPTQNTGVYFIQKQDDSSEKEKFKNIAVFKVGRKRAAMELIVRTLAYHLGLERHAISGMYGALLNPPLLTDKNTDETVEELWDALEKVFQKLVPDHENLYHFGGVKAPGLRFPQVGPMFSNMDPLAGTQPRELSRSQNAKDFRGRALVDSHSSETDTDDEEPVSRFEKDGADFFADFNSDVPTNLTSYNSASLLVEESTESESNLSHSESEDEEPHENEFERTACAVVGIVQPFLQETQKVSLYDYTLMTMLALAIGLRDGKEDGYKGSTLFDVEDCFPIRMDPVYTPGVIEQSASAIDLPYLDKDARTNTSLSLEEVRKLAELVHHWKVNTIIRELERLKIQYEDKSAEKMAHGSKGLDEGGCPVKVVKAEPPHLINGHLNHLTEENEKRRILLPDQLEACSTRLQRIRDFITACTMQQKTFTPQELVYAVDRWGKIYLEAIHRSPSLPRHIDRILEGQGPNHVTGRLLSPVDLQISIGENDYYEHTATTPPPSRLVAALENSAGFEDMPPLEED